MNYYNVDLRPRDLLFFRRGRPMDGSHIGEGATWPLPNVFHEALLTELYKSRGVASHQGPLRMRSLRTFGLFPRLGGEEYLPVPLDIAPDGKTLAQPCEIPGTSNLPAPLRHPVATFCAPSKKSLHPWIAQEQISQYLQEKPFTLTPEEAFYGIEMRYGIGINPHTWSVKEGEFYMASYLRLREENCILRGGIAVTDPQEEEYIEKLAGKKEIPLILGGNRGVVYMTLTRTPLPKKEAFPEERRVKWILKTPAIFGGGWLPSWIDKESGMVKLRKKTVSSRQKEESRQQWRNRLQECPFIKAKLVAALPDKPLPLSGWSLVEGGPKATRLAVPAGSVYYFEAENPEEGRALAEALGNNNPRSDSLGEKGFGLGYCGSWNLKSL